MGPTFLFRVLTSSRPFRRLLWGKTAIDMVSIWRGRLYWFTPVTDSCLTSSSSEFPAALPPPQTVRSCREPSSGTRHFHLAGASFQRSPRLYSTTVRFSALRFFWVIAGMSYFPTIASPLAAHLHLDFRQGLFTVYMPGALNNSRERRLGR